MGSWSIILNVILLIGVVVAITRSLLSRRKDYHKQEKQFPKIGAATEAGIPARDNCDEIIAVRKVNQETTEFVPILARTIENSEDKTQESFVQCDDVPALMLFLLAKDDRKLAGYELLQTLLAAGLRFGESSLFHRHLHQNGQGPILCSVAAATSTGTFDMHNIGAFSAKGLCIFMKPSESPVVDAERFAVMLDTARQLSEDLDAYLLDDNKQPLSEMALERYHRLLKVDTSAELERA